MLKKYKVLRPISLGTRVEAGSIVEINEDDAARYATELQEIVEAPKEAEKPAEVAAEASTEEVAPAEVVAEKPAEVEVATDTTDDEESDDGAEEKV